MARARIAALTAVVVVLAGGAAVGGYAETRAVRAHTEPVPTTSAPPTPAAVTAATASPTPAPTTTTPVASAAAVRTALAAAVTAPALGGRLLARVVDADSGTVLYDRGGTVAAAPASTAKLLTAAAVLTVHPATYRLTTTVVRGPGNSVVLVGGGDPTLTAATGNEQPAYAGAARIADLAKKIMFRPSEIVVDDSLFAGPSVAPQWDAGDAPSEYGAPITALMADGGRATPAATVRSGTPDLAAGQALAKALGGGIPVVRGTAPHAAAVLATVRSAPLETLVTQMLQDSDNVIADVLARQVALARHRPASFAGAATAIREVLAQEGVAVGSGMVDGSGLAASDRLTAQALTGVLRLIASRATVAISGLPVAGWSGTLAGRYAGSSAAGEVRAKTGTLTGVSTLAGFARDADGRLLAFAFLADQVTPGDAGTLAAEAALDVLATRLVVCHCS